jgi:hypothetical protein
MAGVPVIREPVTEPWGLVEMWIEERADSRSSASIKSMA